MAAFKKLGNYKDSSNKVAELEKIFLAEANVGDIVSFGSYQGKSIEWIVLEKKAKTNKIFLISRDLVDTQAYNDSFISSVTWETCSLRAWLNSTFYDAAFNINQKQIIADTLVFNKFYTDYGTSVGNKTTDKIFLLSISEIDRYLNTIQNNCNSNCDWLLRSPGYMCSNGQVLGDIDMTTPYAIRLFYGLI